MRGNFGLKIQTRACQIILQHKREKLNREKGYQKLPGSENGMPGNLSTYFPGSVTQPCAIGKGDSGNKVECMNMKVQTSVTKPLFLENSSATENLSDLGTRFVKDQPTLSPSCKAFGLESNLKNNKFDNNIRIRYQQTMINGKVFRQTVYMVNKVYNNIMYSQLQKRESTGASFLY